MGRGVGGGGCYMLVDWSEIAIDAEQKGHHDSLAGWLGA